MKTRHFFAGVNSPLGFYSCFDMIAPDSECKRKIYIKGGPGTGKSTLMKKIAARAGEEGYDADIFHCSSDSSSLDGIYLPQLKTAAVDATAPHNSDPEYPGVNGEIFNAAEFLSSDAVRKNSEDIMRFTRYKKTAFSKAYAYLSAAAPIISDIEKMHRQRMYMHGIDIEAKKTISKLLPDIIMPKTGKLRKLFLSAVCSEGYINYLDTVFSPRYTVSVKGGCGTSEFISKIMNAALERGFYVEAFYCPMAPQNKPEHIIIPDMKIAFTTYNHFHHFLGNETIDLDEYASGIPAETDREWHTAEDLMENAQNALSEAHTAHSCLESFYVPAMDFEKLSKEADKLTDSIFNQMTV